jgi:hypothetical protein
MPKPRPRSPDCKAQLNNSPRVSYACQCSLCGPSPAVLSGVLRGPVFCVVAQVLLSGMVLEAAHAQDRDEAIVFISPPGLSHDLTSALDEAVSAQVSLVGARLVFLIAADDDAGLEERMTQAEALAKEHHAVGVFWIDARPSRRWFLYIMDRGGSHVVVRPLSVEGASMDAAIEAAALIAGSASDALLKQQSIEVRLAQPPAAPPPEEAALQLEVGYSATDFAPSIPVIHGIWVGASWLLPTGPYFGLSYVWNPPIRVERDLSVQLTRYPIWLHGGMRWKLFEGLELGGEVGFSLEMRTRTTTSQIIPLRTLPPKTRATYLASLRFVAEYRIFDWLAVLVRLSPELSLNAFDYKKDTVDSEITELIYLSPYRLRFTAQIGVAVIR